MSVGEEFCVEVFEVILSVEESMMFSFPLSEEQLEATNRIVKYEKVDDKNVFFFSF